MIGGLDVNLGAQRQQALVQRVLAQYNANLAGSQQLNKINAGAQAYLPKNPFAPRPVTGGAFSETNRPLDPNTAFGNLPAAPVPSGGNLPTQTYSLITDAGKASPFKLPYVGGGTAGRVPVGPSSGRVPVGLRPTEVAPRPPVPDPPTGLGRPPLPEQNGQLPGSSAASPLVAGEVGLSPDSTGRVQVPVSSPKAGTTRPTVPSRGFLAYTRSTYMGRPY